MRDSVTLYIAGMPPFTAMIAVAALASLSLGGPCASAADSIQPAKQPVLGKVGKLIFHDEFGETKIQEKWVPLHGTRWQVTKGRLRGEPSTAEHQAAAKARGKHTGGTPSSRLLVPTRNSVMQFDFKLSGKLSGAHFGFNDGSVKTGTGHVCRVTVSVRDGIRLIKDKSSKIKGDKDEVLDTSDFKVEREKWYTLVLETRGPDIAAHLVNGPTLRGSHKRLDLPKDQINLPTRGGGVIFYDNVRIWELVPRTTAPIDVSAAGAEHPHVTATINGTSAFAKSNLHVWAYEEYDKIKRTPEERARLLKELGITKAGYICRNAKRVAEFEAYVQAYQQEGIELIAVWTPVNTEKPLEEPQISGLLDVAERYKLKIQWWLTLEEDFDKLSEAGRVERAVVRLRPLVIEANKRGCRLVIYGHGRKKWFTQCENQIAILESLKKEMPAAQLGIVYNFHQSHAQMDRLKNIFPQLKPHLVAVNLNGMHSKGPVIAPLGNGDRESEMINVIYQSGWRGPVGIIGHNRSADAKQTLQKNLDGLRSILKEIGDEPGFATF